MNRASRSIRHFSPSLVCTFVWLAGVAAATAETRFSARQVATAEAFVELRELVDALPLADGARTRGWADASPARSDRLDALTSWICADGIQPVSDAAENGDAARFKLQVALTDLVARLREAGADVVLDGLPDSAIVITIDVRDRDSFPPGIPSALRESLEISKADFALGIQWRSPEIDDGGSTGRMALAAHGAARRDALARLAERVARLDVQPGVSLAAAARDPDLMQSALQRGLMPALEPGAYWTSAGDCVIAERAASRELYGMAMRMALEQVGDLNRLPLSELDRWLTTAPESVTAIGFGAPPAAWLAIRWGEAESGEVNVEPWWAHTVEAEGEADRDDPAPVYTAYVRATQAARARLAVDLGDRLQLTNANEQVRTEWTLHTTLLANLARPNYSATYGDPVRVRVGLAGWRVEALRRRIRTP